MADIKPNEKKETEFTHLGGQSFGDADFAFSSPTTDESTIAYLDDDKVEPNDLKPDDFHDKVTEYNHANAGAADSIAGTIETAAAERHQEQEKEEKKERARNFLTQGAITEILDGIAENVDKMGKELKAIDSDFREMEQEAQQLIDTMKAEQAEVAALLERQKEELAALEESLANGEVMNNEDYHRAMIEQKQAEIENTQAVFDMYEDNIATSTETLNKARQEIEEANRRLEDVKAQIAQAREDNPDVTEQQIQALRQKEAELKQTIKQAEAAVEQLNSDIEYSKANMEFLGEHLKEESLSCWIDADLVREETEGIKAKTELLHKTQDIAADRVIDKAELAEFLALSKEAGVEDAAQQFAQNIQKAGYQVELEDGTFATGADAEQAILSKWDELNKKKEELTQNIQEADRQIDTASTEISDLDKKIEDKTREIELKEQEIAAQSAELAALQQDYEKVEENIAREHAELQELEDNVATVEQALEEHGSIIEFMADKHSIAEAGMGVTVDRDEILMHEGQPVFMDSGSLQLYTISQDADGNQVQNFIEDPAVKMDLQAQIFAEGKYAANFVKGINPEDGETPEEHAALQASIQSDFDGYYETMAMSGLGFAAGFVGSTKGMTSQEARQISQDAIEEQKQILIDHTRPALEEKIQEAEKLKTEIEAKAQAIQQEQQTLADEKQGLEEQRQALIEKKEQDQEELEDVQDEINKMAEEHNLDVPKHNFDEEQAARNEMKNLLDQAATRPSLSLTQEEVERILSSGIISYEELDETATNAGVFTPEEMNLYANGTQLEGDQPTQQEQLQLTASFSQANPQPEPEEVAIIPTAPAANGSVFNYGNTA